MEYIAMIVGPLLVQIPLLIILAVGLFLAMTRWNRHPQVSRWAAIGFGGVLFNAIVFGVLSPFLVATLSRSGQSATSIGTTMAAVSIIGALLAAIWWGFIIAAVFGGRNKEM